MSRRNTTDNLLYLEKFTSRKVEGIVPPLVGETPDSLAAWIERYLLLAVNGVRSEAVAEKIALHLERFLTFFRQAYGHERISTVLKRDVVAWQRSLVEEGLPPLEPRALSPKQVRSPPSPLHCYPSSAPCLVP